MTAFTAPTETRAFRPDYSGKPKREIESRWVLSPEGAAETVRVTLTSSHWGESKKFSSRLTWETASSERGFSVTSWASDHHTVGVHAEPVARYSKKALEAFHAEALATLEHHFESEAVQAVFTQAAERHGLVLA